MAENNFWDNLNDTIAGFGNFAEGVLGSAGGVMDVYNDITGDNEPAPQEIPSYNANASMGDWLSMPNVYLMGFGVLLLLVALVLAKR